MEPNMNMDTPMQEEKKPVGSIIAIIVIVLVLGFGAYYFLKQVPTAGETGAGATTIGQTVPDATLSSLSDQSTSTDIDAIQKDLDATNLSGLDLGLSEITI